MHVIGGRRCEIDASIVDLVDTLNSIPGVETRGSCGGHRDPGPCQEAEHDFYVNLHVSADEQGWKALEILGSIVDDWSDGSSNFRDDPPPAVFDPVDASISLYERDGPQFVLAATDSPGGKHILVSRIQHLLREPCGATDYAEKRVPAVLSCDLPFAHLGPHAFKA